MARFSKKEKLDLFIRLTRKQSREEIRQAEKFFVILSIQTFLYPILFFMIYFV